MTNRITKMDDFLIEYERVLEGALSYGARNVPLTGFPDGEIDWKIAKRFISACHRGWERAQDRVVDLVQQLSCEQNLDEKERLYRQLLLRKIIDTIACTMLEGKIYAMRRLAFHGRVPPVDLRVIKETQQTANRNNHESRLTFSVIADLTTFVHICDLLKVDFRQGHRRLSLIELKGGKVNEILLTQLERYELKDESLNKIRDDDEIKTNYKKQATRIFRQKIRLDQVVTMLRDDKGIDPETKKPIFLVGDVKGNSVEEEHYGQFLAKLIESSEKLQHGVSSGTVNRCLHLGVGYSSNKNTARTSAIYAATYSMKKQLKDSSIELAQIKNQLLTLIPEKDLTIMGDLFKANLYSLPVIPFLLWPISKQNKFDLMKRNLVIVFIFDLPGFFLLGKRIGVDLQLSTRKEADSIKKEVGVKNVTTFGNRMVKCIVGGQSIVLLALIQRFLTNLSRPAQFLSFYKKGHRISRFIDLQHNDI